jgi:protein-S-isoprenylcysteine O-methyltransferase Ste14
MSLGDTVMMSLEALLFLGNVVTCFLFFNSRGLAGVMWIGWAAFAIAVIVGWQGYAALSEQGDQRKDENWLQTRALVDTGLYAVVRHPIYLSFLLLSVAPAFLTQHLASIGISGVLALVIYRDMSREDRDNIRKFGEAYRTYMKKVPRANIVVGFVRLVIRTDRRGIR